MKISASALRRGMGLARDMVSSEGLLLLSKDYLLDDAMIEQIRSFEQAEGRALVIYVRPGKG